jgi:murein DD-endopeptidase MepM/ murein hydrolase activator NlpD
VAAAADGVIAKVSDNGMGFSSLVIRHEGGFATLYGHVSGFLVQEGQHVRAGDPVALSGGQPGTKGAGKMTTGSHLHFEVTKSGIHVDPLTYLPEWR